MSDRQYLSNKSTSADSAQISQLWSRGRKKRNLVLHMHSYIPGDDFPNWRFKRKRKTRKKKESYFFKTKQDSLFETVFFFCNLLCNQMTGATIPTTGSCNKLKNGKKVL